MLEFMMIKFTNRNKFHGNFALIRTTSWIPKADNRFLESKNTNKIIVDNAGIIKDDLNHHQIVLPPLLAFLTTSRVLLDSPMPHVLLQADQSVQWPTLQLTGPPNKNNSNSNFYCLES